MEGSAKSAIACLLEGLLEGDIIFLQGIESKLERIEEQLLQHIPEEFNEMIMAYRKLLSRLHAYYQQLMEISDLMYESTGVEAPADEKNAWQHYAARTERLHNYVEVLREYLVQVREFYQSRIAEQQNHVMRFLTVITTIFLPLSLIAGVYGMNFYYMPGIYSLKGFPILLAISGLIIVIELIIFKWKKFFK